MNFTVNEIKSLEFISLELADEKLGICPKENICNEVKTFNLNKPSTLTGECYVTPDFYNLFELKDDSVFELQYPIMIQRRKHKKKRINKKWAKRYGYKNIPKTSRGWKFKEINEDEIEFYKDF